MQRYGDVGSARTPSDLYTHIGPCRSTSILPRFSTTMVDAGRGRAFPASNMRSGASGVPTNSARTATPEKTDGRPERFADVEVIGPPSARESARGQASDGTRRATEPSFADAVLPRQAARNRATTVSGPGQCAVARRESARDNTTRRSAMARSAQMSGNAFSADRPFIL